MGDRKNLLDETAIEKLKHLVDQVKICFFCTDIKSGMPFNTRPMTVQKIDEEGNIWFLSDRASGKNSEIEIDPNVQLLFADLSHEGYLSISGKAEIIHDKYKIKELWQPLAKVWFTKGVDDPNISVIKVSPNRGHYWDTKHGKMVSFIKMIAGMVIGKTLDGGVEGEIIVK
ncbi:MAG: general stress protein [Bacteroidetes bacterium]|nr:MAG: general stress protein [Bacteroidota bacterium]